MTPSEPRMHTTARAGQQGCAGCASSWGCCLSDCVGMKDNPQLCKHVPDLCMQCGGVLWRGAGDEWGLGEFSLLKVKENTSTNVTVIRGCQLRGFSTSHTHWPPGVPSQSPLQPTTTSPRRTRVHRAVLFLSESNYLNLRSLNLSVPPAHRGSVLPCHEWSHGPCRFESTFFAASSN
jgi:hypothetical protein